MNRFLFYIFLCACLHFSLVTSIETYGKNKTKKIVNHEAKFGVTVGQNGSSSTSLFGKNLDHSETSNKETSSNGSTKQWNLFMVTGSIVLLLVLFVYRISQYIHSRKIQKLEEKKKLIQDKLLQLQLKEFTKEDKYDCCSICLEDYEYSDQLRILPCDHAFHSKCVDQWLSTKKRFCPLCKQKVLGEDDEDDYESSTDLLEMF